MRSQNQSRWGAIIETFLNTFSGFILSYILWIFIIRPMYNIDTSYIENLQITGIFTIMSICRGYAWRRVMNYAKS